MFENFNLIKYSLTHDGKKLTDYILTDITTRVKVTAGDDALFIFNLHAGESPEDVSQELYDTPYYHWTIMMLNDVFDIHSEWYLTDSQLYEYASTKYNVVHEVLPANINTTTDTLFVTGHKFNPNDIVKLESDNMPNGLSSNTEYYVYNTTDDSFQLTTTLEGTTPVNITTVNGSSVIVTCNKVDQPAYWVDDQDNIMSSALNLYEGWSNNEDTRTEYKAKINVIIGNQPSRTAYVPSMNKTVLESDTDVLDITEAVTPIDQISIPTYRVITNFEYEEMMNARRQSIKVIRPEYIKTFVDRFNKVVKN